MVMSFALSNSSPRWTARTTARPFRTAQISCREATNNKWNIAQNLTTDSNHLRCLENYNDELSIKHAKGLMDVRHMLGEEEKQPLKCLVMVDTIQRLGIDYHFQKEIEAELWRLQVTTGNCIYESQALDEVSLYFRLLRQGGYYVHADVFDNFKDKEGKFGGTLTKDIRSLRELYEATQLSIEGEHTLDEAANFSSHLLNEWIRNVDDDKGAIIANTLRHPYHKSLAKFEAKNFMSEFKGNNAWENTVQELSCMDSFIAQSIHRGELRQILKWWNDLGLAKELKLARDQPLKWYTWPMAILTDLSLSDERMELTKSISLIYIIDDVFDLYGKPDELTLFTEAVNRWELDAVEHLPDYMKMSFRALYDITNETGQKIQNKHGSNPVVSLRKAWSSLCNAFLAESKWFASKEMPKAEEYPKNGIVSSGVHVALIHMFFLLGLGVSEESAKKIEGVSGIISSVATILRLWDDLGNAKDEDQDGHDGSYIDCYMKEHKGVSVEFAREHVFKLISDEWKGLNKECLLLNRSFASFQKGALNLARMVSFMYDYDNHQCLPILEQYIKSMFYDDICLWKGSSKQNQREPLPSLGMKCALFHTLIKYEWFK